MVDPRFGRNLTVLGKTYGRPTSIPVVDPKRQLVVPEYRSAEIDIEIKGLRFEFSPNSRSEVMYPHATADDWCAKAASPRSGWVIVDRISCRPISLYAIRCHLNVANIP